MIFIAGRPTMILFDTGLTMLVIGSGLPMIFISTGLAITFSATGLTIRSTARGMTMRSAVGRRREREEGLKDPSQAGSTVTTALQGEEEGWEGEATQMAG